MSEQRKIAIFTSARSEYGSFRGLMRKIQERENLELCLLVSGNHLVDADGSTVDEIIDDGFSIAVRIVMFDSDRSRGGFSRALGRELIGVTDALLKEKPHLILINGDRAELLPLATAAMALGIPIAHIAGGEVTEGAMDDSVRHAVTKLSHLHFPTNELHARRICQMGEESWRVTVTGEPALDFLNDLPVLSREDLERDLGISLVPPVVLVTFHPETLDDDGAGQVDALIQAMKEIEATYVVTYPNADPESLEIRSKLESFCDLSQSAVMVASLGQVRYYSMMRVSDVMLGNSSSGLWEAPSFELPVVNVGGRQTGRLRAENVIDVEDVESDQITKALQVALSDRFRSQLKGIKNPYGSGEACDQILDVLSSVDLGNSLLRKKFIDTKADDDLDFRC